MCTKRLASQLLGSVVLVALGVPAAGAGGAPLPAMGERDRVGVMAVPELEISLADEVPNVGYGPLRLGLQSPAQSLRLGLTPRTPSTLPQGGIDAHVTGTWVNIWCYSESEGYRVDGEQLQTGFGLGYGLTDSTKVDFEYQLRTRFGGVMDPFIEGFHDLFGLDQGGRKDFPRNELAVEFEATPGRPAYSREGGDLDVYASQLKLTLEQTVTPGDGAIPALGCALTMASDLGQADGVKGGGPVQLGATVSAAKRCGDFYGYLALGFAWYGEQEVGEIELHATQLSALIAIEWRAFRRTSVVVQYMVGQGAVKDSLGAFSDPSHEITLGLKTELGSGTVLELGFLENLVTYDNSPDFGVHLGVTHRF